MAKSSDGFLAAAVARLTRRVGVTRVIALSVAALALLVMTACTNDATVLEHASASAFSLSVSVADQSYLSDTTVAITATILASGTPAAFSANQHLTCNGVALQNPEKYNFYTATVARQPTGAAYTFEFTDDQGRKTTFAVPSIGRPAVISPAAGAVVPLPQPTDPSNASSSYAPLNVTYTPPVLPTGATVDLSFAARSGTAQAPYVYGSVFGAHDSTATGAYSLAGDDFAKFQPGPGEIDTALIANWSIPSDFASVAAMYTGSGVVPFTWAAPQQ